MHNLDLLVEHHHRELLLRKRIRRLRLRLVWPQHAEQNVDGMPADFSPTKRAKCSVERGLVDVALGTICDIRNPVVHDTMRDGA